MRSLPLLTNHANTNDTTYLLLSTQPPRHVLTVDAIAHLVQSDSPLTSPPTIQLNGPPNYLPSTTCYFPLPPHQVPKVVASFCHFNVSLRCSYRAMAGT